MPDLPLQCLGSVVVTLSCCGTPAQFLCGIVGILVPLPGIELTSPALQGGFLTTGPPGKSLLFNNFMDDLNITLKGILNLQMR